MQLAGTEVVGSKMSYFAGASAAFDFICGSIHSCVIKGWKATETEPLRLGSKWRDWVHKAIKSQVKQSAARHSRSIKLKKHIWASAGLIWQRKKTNTNWNRGISIISIISIRSIWFKDARWDELHLEMPKPWRYKSQSLSPAPKLGLSLWAIAADSSYSYHPAAVPVTPPGLRGHTVCM